MPLSDAASLGPLTHDAFLGGRLQLWQPRRGHRAGFESVLLGAAVAAQAGETVLDLGAGVGAAALCAGARIEGLDLRLVEKDDRLLEIASRNIEALGLQATVVCADATRTPAELERAGLAQQSADHVVCNPPFRGQEAGTSSPDRLKAAAHSEPLASVTLWYRTALILTRHGGSLTFVLPPYLLPAFLGWSDGRIGALRILPVAHRAKTPASRVLVTGLRARKTPPQLLPFLVLEHDDGRPTAEADAVLREGSGLF